MYPDIRDTQLVIRKLGLQTSPETIWEDAALVRGFLFNAHLCCKNHGRHALILVSDLKCVLEGFIGRTVSDDAMMVGMYLLRLDVKKGKTDRQTVRFPPLERLEERREVWKAIQQSFENEIQQEVSKVSKAA
jgi:hypothetical protein